MTGSGRALNYQAEELGLCPEGTGEPWGEWEQGRGKISSACKRTLWVLWAWSGGVVEAR